MRYEIIYEAICEKCKTKHIIPSGFKKTKTDIDIGVCNDCKGKLIITNKKTLETTDDFKTIISEKEVKY